MLYGLGDTKPTASTTGLTMVQPTLQFTYRPTSGQTAPAATTSGAPVVDVGPAATSDKPAVVSYSPPAGATPEQEISFFDRILGSVKSVGPLDLTGTAGAGAPTWLDLKGPALVWGGIAVIGGVLLWRTAKARRAARAPAVAGYRRRRRRR